MAGLKRKHPLPRALRRPRAEVTSWSTSTARERNTDGNKKIDKIFSPGGQAAGGLVAVQSTLLIHPPLTQEPSCSGLTARRVCVLHDII